MAAAEPPGRLPLLLPRRRKPPALLLASGAIKHATSLPVERAMQHTLHTFSASGWAAAQLRKCSIKKTGLRLAQGLAAKVGSKSS